MHLLPTTLACLADQSEKNPTGRFALSNIQLRLHGDNTFTAASTDTKVLVRVTGPCVGPVEEYPEHPAMANAPNRKLDALIPAASWRKAFSTAAKVTRKQKNVLRSVAVKLGDQLATFGATDGDSFPVEQTRVSDGRFPPVADIIPKPGSGKARFWVDPLYLADVLKTIAAIACDEDNRRVEIEVNGEKPIAIRAQRADGIRADGVLMPLPGEKEEERDEVEEQAGAPGDATEIVRLKESRKEVAEQLEKANHRIAELERENERVRNILQAREDRIADLVEDCNGLREKLQTALKVACDRPAISATPARGMSRRERLQLVGDQS
jgi:hypothetical protein